MTTAAKIQIPNILTDSVEYTNSNGLINKVYSNFKHNTYNIKLKWALILNQTIKSKKVKYLMLSLMLGCAIDYSAHTEQIEQVI